MSIDKHGIKRLSTVSGAIVNIMVSLVVLAYAGYKVTFLVERKGTKVTHSVVENAYD